MKWLLVTNTENRNPGDEWIRIGVQRLVRDVDPSPEFILRNKEFIEDQDSEVEFDKAIWCGSPLFWSHQYQNCWENHWWNKWMNNWLFKEKSKVLVLGVGDVLGRHIHDEVGYYTAIRTVKEKCWKLVTRNPVSRDSEIEVSCCPSTFALAGDKTPKTLRLCNLMPDGAHDAFFDEEEAEIWRGKVKTVSDCFIKAGFEIVCHSKFEDEFAESLGWPNAKIHYEPKSSEDYLPLYAQAQCYVGNRLHGAMVTIGAGGTAMAIGYDSRLAMVAFVGGRTVRPSQFYPDDVEWWSDMPHHPLPDHPYDWQPEYDRQVVIVRQFSEL